MRARRYLRNLADYIKAGYEAVKGDDEWYTIQKKPVAEIVGGDQYATLEAAVADLADGQTLKLLSDYTLENAITVNADATIDFGGKTLTATVSKHLTIMAGKTVSITNGTDQFNDVGNYGIEVYGTLNIRAGMNLIVEGKEEKK